ncbi:MAG: cytochrome P450 [Aggregatilineales bacterium]
MTDVITGEMIWQKSVRANPQAFYEEMRQTSPIFKGIGPMTGNTFWFFTHYDDVVSVLKDQRFGKEFRKHLTPEEAAAFGPEPAPDDMFAVINRHLLNVDPPDHTRLRALVHKAFTPRMVENLRPRITEIADDLLNDMEGKSEVDLLDSFAFPLPITVIAEMLGIAPEDRIKFREWTRVLLFDPDMDNNMASIMEFTSYMNAKIDEYQQTPADNILSALIQAEEGGDSLDRMELLSMIFLLLVAGHETTVNLIGNGTLALMQHRDQLEKLHNDPALIKTAVEELLRWNGPVETPTTRWAFEDVEISGVTIPKGDMVLPSLLAANRDPAMFENPNTLDITRDPNRHIAFGHGIHYCVGAPLARLEGTIAINALLARFPNIDLAVPEESLEWAENLLLHGMRALPVRL